MGVDGPLSPIRESPLDAPPEGAMSTFTATCLLCALSLGVGVFLIPSVMASLGFGAGITLLICFGILSTAVARLVADLADEAGAGSLRELITKSEEPFLAQSPEGGLPWSAPLLLERLPGGSATAALLAYANVASIITLVTGNASHVQLIADMMWDLMEYFVTGDYGTFTFGLAHKAILLGIFLLVVMPYCFLDDLSALRFAGEAVSGTVITTSAVIGVFCLIAIAEGRADGAAGGAYPLPAAPPDVATLVRLVPTICFTYTSLFTLFDVRAKLLAGHGQRDGAQKLRRAVVMAGALQTTLYTCLAVVAAVAFGTSAGTTVHGHHNGNGNVLYNFPADNYLVSALCLALIVVILLDYPVIQFSAVETAIGMAEPLARRHSAAFKKWARPGFSVLFALAVLVIDLFIKDLSDLFGLCGSLGISGYCYVVPGILLARRADSRAVRAFGVFVSLLGAAICVASTFYIFQGLVDASPPAAPVPPSAPPPLEPRRLG